MCGACAAFAPSAPAFSARLRRLPPRATVTTLGPVQRCVSLTLKVVAAVAVTAFVVDLAWSLMTRVAEPAFAVETRDGDFEVRAYAQRVVAETTVDGTWGAVGNEGFRRLAGYIFGGNTTRASIAMTAPVAQRETGRAIAMTAPVAQRAVGAAWVVSFTMPAGETLATLPRPIDARVTLRELPAARVVVVRFSGLCGEGSRVEHTRALRAWAEARGLAVTGEPEVNRYNPPWTLWFLRRNEVWLALRSDA